MTKKFGWGHPEKPSSCKLELRNALILLVELRDLGMEKLLAIFWTVVQSKALPGHAPGDVDAIGAPPPLLSVVIPSAMISMPSLHEEPAAQTLNVLSINLPAVEKGQSDFDKLRALLSIR